MADVRTLALGAAPLLATALAACGEPKPSIAEALATDPKEVFAKSEDYKAAPKARPDDLPPPTDAEFKAWNRKDPGGETHLYKWDKANIDRMVGYWREMECFREKMLEEANKALGAEPGSPVEEQWFQFKRQFIPFLDGWQMRLFANEPRILEKSKFIGNFLEAHELLMHGYPEAFNNADKTAIEKNDAHWIIVENKNKKYTKNLGAEWPELDLSTPKAVENHKEFCEKALTPPDPNKKRKRVKKSPI